VLQQANSADLVENDPEAVIEQFDIRASEFMERRPASFWTYSALKRKLASSVRPFERLRAGEAQADVARSYAVIMSPGTLRIASTCFWMTSSAYCEAFSATR
jgi:hypothetical protein